MSLKAKLEAVIYAAEEPVTLAQLAALFADDAFAWRAQQEAASAEQADGVAPSLSQANEEPEHLKLEQVPADSIPFEPASNFRNSVEQAAEAPPTPAEDAAIDAEAKRQVRLRDREARAILRQLLDELIASCASDDRGVEIREIAGGFRMATKPECHDAVRLFVKSLKPVLKLSLPALETLAVIAYKQPVTAPEVNEIRGVDSSGVFGSLLARKLIATAGRKPVIGRPILYKTTREFLLRFGLKNVSELPSMEEFEKMAALEFDEPESAAGEESAQESNPAHGPEFDEAASEELEDAPSESLQSQAAPQAEAPASQEPPTGSPTISAEFTPAEAAPAAPSPHEQAETETSPHDE
jgi:segregation and condensation protein B